MFNGILGRIRGILLVALLGGPAWAAYNWYEINEMKKVDAGGVVVAALVDGGMETRRRGVSSYSLDLRWQDESGAPHTKSAHVTSDFAHQILQDGALMIETLDIKYLPGHADERVVVVEDYEATLKQDQEMIMFGGIAGAVGLVGMGLFMLFGKKKEEAAPPPAAA